MIRVKQGPRPRLHQPRSRPGGAGPARRGHRRLPGGPRPPAQPPLPPTSTSPGPSGTRGGSPTPWGTSAGPTVDGEEGPLARPLPVGDWVRDCQRLLELDAGCRPCSKARTSPRDADERLGFAQLCHLKGMHADAARLFAEAFAAGAGRARRRVAVGPIRRGPRELRRPGAGLRRQAARPG